MFFGVSDHRVYEDIEQPAILAHTVLNHDFVLSNPFLFKIDSQPSGIALRIFSALGRDVAIEDLLAGPPPGYFTQAQKWLQCPPSALP